MRSIKQPRIIAVLVLVMSLLAPVPAFADSVCPAGYTGTYPACVIDTSGGHTGTSASAKYPDGTYWTQKQVAAVSFALAVGLSYLIVKQFRWRSHD